MKKLMLFVIIFAISTHAAQTHNKADSRTTGNLLVASAKLYDFKSARIFEELERLENVSTTMVEILSKNNNVMSRNADIVQNIMTRLWSELIDLTTQAAVLYGPTTLSRNEPVVLAWSNSHCQATIIRVSRITAHLNYCKNLALLSQAAFIQERAG